MWNLRNCFDTRIGHLGSDKNTNNKLCWWWILKTPILEPTELGTLSNQMDKSALPMANDLVLIEEKAPILVYVPDTIESELELVSRPHFKPNRLRRTLTGNSNPAVSPMSYQQVWPVLNAAKDRAVELADEGHRRKEQAVTKRQPLEMPEVSEHLTRYSRNLPDGQEKMFQIQGVRDLPMFRFG